MKLKLAAAMLPVFALAACGSNGSSNSNAAPDFRTQALQAKPLSPEQKAKIKSIMKSESENNPSVDLYFETSNIDQKLAKLTPQGLSLYKLTRSQCQITESPKDTSSDKNDGVPRTKTATKSISGTNCPISYTANNTDTSNVKMEAKQEFPGTSNASVSVLATGGSRTSSETSQKILDENARRSVSIVETQTSTSFEMNYNSLLIKDQKFVSGNVTYAMLISMTGKLADGRPMLMNMKFQGSSGPSGELKDLMALGKGLITMTVPDVDPIVIALTGDGKTTEIIVNGEIYTRERFEKDFGGDIGLSSSSSIQKPLK